MKKTSIKKILAAVLAFVMLFCMAACDSQNPENPNPSESPSTNPQQGGTNVEPETGVKFPLEEEVTIEIMVKDNAERDELLEKCVLWNDLYEATNVKVEFIPLPEDDPLTALNGMFNAGTQGDAIFSQFISDSDLSALAANDLLLPLNDYINDEELMPNFNGRVLTESPSTEGFVAAPNGNIYCLPRYVANEANYVEGKFFINTAWLKAVGKEVPTTLAELEDVLVAFRDGDPNGNGEKDEIPFLISTGSLNAYSHFEAFMGMYGIATKDNTNDNYVFVENGKVNFAPVTENYKAAIKTLTDWYDKDLLWSECFTGTAETFNSIVLTADQNVGVMVWSGTPDQSGNWDPMLPVDVEGYDTNWFYHPGRLGVKGSFCLTNSCENPEIVMAWIDQFYSFQNSVRALYGEPGYQYEWTADDEITFTGADQSVVDQMYQESPTLGYALGAVYQHAITQAFTADDYANKIHYATDAGDPIKSIEAFELYKAAGILNDEIWPRPYFAAEDMNRLNELRTDIFNTVAEKKAAWVAGEGDIDAEWDQYVADLEAMGLNEFVDILQKTYDGFLTAMQ